MIGAITGLSVLGGSLALAKTAIDRAVSEFLPPVPPVDNRGGSQAPSAASSATRTTGTPRQAEPAASGNRGEDDTGDTAEISPEGLAQAKVHAGKTPGVKSENLSPKQTEQLSKLRDRDQKVRTHEAAHQAAGGRYAGSASFSYQTGPDGKQYAVGGEVPIDLSPVKDDPQATIAKMEQVRAAATAPADPSDADRQVAAKAAQIEQQAHAEQLAKTSTGAGSEAEAHTGVSTDPPKAGAAPTSGETPSAHIDVYA